jgi:hypothetical protein
MDMKPISGEPRPKLGLPTPPAPPPKPAKPIEPLGTAEQLFHDAMRDGLQVTAAYFDGSEITGRPLAFSRYSFLIEVGGEEVAIFKAALRSLRAQKETAE